jgi:hypothetical protein
MIDGPQEGAAYVLQEPYSHREKQEIWSAVGFTLRQIYPLQTAQQAGWVPERT